jgi:hypothetical protein
MAVTPCWISPRLANPHGDEAAHARRGAADSANNFLLKDRCALIDQMSFFVTLPGGGFVLAVRAWDRADKNEISAVVFNVATDDLPHLTGSYTDLGRARIIISSLAAVRAHFARLREMSDLSPESAKRRHMQCSKPVCYSITSSALASNVCGTLRPTAGLRA